MEAKTIVCISCYFKGYDFMDEMKKLGNKVILITAQNLKEKQWPWHAIDEAFYMDEISPSVWNLDHLIQGFSYLLKTRNVDAVIALDDYDVEKAALIREIFRIPGMGQTTYRYFRDKLAMRKRARDSGINVPEFTEIFNDALIANFIHKVHAPWVLKPRSEASAAGVKKIKSEEELWKAISSLGEQRHLFLLESFKPGDVYHVDSLVYHGKVVFTCCSKYLASPMAVSHEGGVFRTRTLNRSSEEFQSLYRINTEVLTNFHMENGIAHSEYIRGEDGTYYFLETSSRAGGAHIPEMVEAATGVNLWREWARLENALLCNKEYSVQKPNEDFAGLIISLTKDKNPETAPYQCEEVVSFIPMDYHIGIIYKSSDEDKVLQRLNEATNTITRDLLNVLPPKNKPAS